MPAQVRPSHAAGVVQMRVRPFEVLAPSPQQGHAPCTADASAIRIDRIAGHGVLRPVASARGGSSPCPSRIRCQAATGSWTKSRQWETQRTLFSSARATMWPPTKVDGVWPFNDAWLRTSL